MQEFIELSRALRRQDLVGLRFEPTGLTQKPAALVLPPTVGLSRAASAPRELLWKSAIMI